MATLQAVESFRGQLDDLYTLTDESVIAALGQIDTTSLATGRLALAALVADITDGYGLVAAGLASEWYADARQQVQTRGRHSARLGNVVLPPGKVDDIVGYSLAPLYGAQPDTELALGRLSGSVQKAVANSARGTIFTNMRNDPTQVRWYRAASSNCCAFCGLLASRGAVYRTEDSANFAPHKKCRCQPGPVWPQEQVELPGYFEDFGSEYDAARKATKDKSDPKAILATWRAQTARN